MSEDELARLRALNAALADKLEEAVKANTSLADQLRDALSTIVVVCDCRNRIDAGSAGKQSGE